MGAYNVLLANAVLEEASDPLAILQFDAFLLLIDACEVRCLGPVLCGRLLPIGFHQLQLSLEQPQLSFDHPPFHQLIGEHDLLFPLSLPLQAQLAQLLLFQIRDPVLRVLTSATPAPGLDLLDFCHNLTILLFGNSVKVSSVFVDAPHHTVGGHEAERRDIIDARLPCG